MVHVLISVLLICGVGLLTIVKSSQMTRISAQPGENVSIWCKRPSQVGQKIHWFKQTNGAAPVGIAHMIITNQLKELKANYLNGFQADRFVMTLNTKNTSLSILNVNVSDSGLYYCGWVRWEMKFSNGSHLDIKDHKKSRKDIFYKLTFIFGALTVILVIILLTLVIVQIRKTQKKDEDQNVTQHHEEPPSMYAALHFSKQKTRRAARHVEDAAVVYSATR